MKESGRVKRIGKYYVPLWGSLGSTNQDRSSFNGAANP
jgi:hypothetical protein